MDTQVERLACVGGRQKERIDGQTDIWTDGRTDGTDLFNDKLLVNDAAERGRL